MAESRRVQLFAQSSDAPSYFSSPSDKKCAQGGENVSDRPADTETVRLVLELFEPDERSFPEFSYNQLIDDKISQSKDGGPLSRREKEEKRENDEVAAIARKLEEKYGAKPKKKKDRIQDLIDIGYGYDEEDSFIDNSEAYDEFVPCSITTRFGGFYVNSGVLQFRRASDAESDDPTTEETKVSRTTKRKLSDGQEKPQKKRCRAGGEMASRLDPKLSTLSETGQADELKIRKKKKAVRTLSVTSMLKKFQKEKERERQKKMREKAAANLGTAATPLFPADAGGGGGTGLTDPLLSLIGSTNDHALIQAASTVDFDIDLDSLLEVSEETPPKSLPQPAVETQLIQSKTDDPTQLNAFSDAKSLTSNSKINLQQKCQPERIQLLSEASSTLQSTPLLEGLPPALEDSIRKLTAVAKTSEGESKLKFFNPDINSILLDIELQCREQSSSLRSKVYTHLSSFLPCSRDTLLKRVKKLLMAQMEEPPGVEDPMQKLREAIGRSMPEQISCFHEDCQVYEQVKTSKAAEDNDEKTGRKGGPKKMFKWNEEIRECLGQMLKAKVDNYKKERKGDQEIEEHLKIWLDNEVKPLWPKGWMQSRVLMKESRKLLDLSSLLVKKAKCEKKQSFAFSDGCDDHQGTPPLMGELSRGAGCVFTEGSDIPSSVAHKEGVALKKGEVQKVGLDVGAATDAESDKSQVDATPTPAPLLDLLADQALAQEQTLPVLHELLAEAAKKHFVQRWNFLEMQSPLLPPPPPQSSPVGFPVSSTCGDVLSQMFQAGNIRHVDAVQVQSFSEDTTTKT
ncbi:ubinuclein-1 [Archocentrus centrarchus]|uniref:ubinuclein-1 n=1 Tax=Archocentrus centrarchus TaxID=63155 RepID=UPI0011E9D310|nr:ubinuclein-1 [Archocentrus centrarchus]